VIESDEKWATGSAPAMGPQLLRLQTWHNKHFMCLEGEVLPI
jgi:hypothetical protein